MALHPERDAVPIIYAFIVHPIGQLTQKMNPQASNGALFGRQIEVGGGCFKRVERPPIVRHGER